MVNFLHMVIRVEERKIIIIFFFFLENDLIKKLF